MILLALGLMVGLILALTGAGGSIIAVPLLMFGMGWTLTQATPVALIAVASSAAIGTLIGLRARIVRYRAAFVMAAGGVSTTWLGLAAAHRLPIVPLTLAFAALLAWIALRMFQQASAQARLAGAECGGGQSSAPCLVDPATGRFRWTGRCGRAFVLSGLLTGFLSGMFGVGGGFVIVPTMRRVTDLPMNSIVATSMMVITLVSSGAVLSAALAGHLPGPAALPFATGAITGMIGGRLVAARVAGPRLQQGFAVIAGGVAVTLAVRVLLTL
jgi:uncharacterized membrane protein YfcA